MGDVLAVVEQREGRIRGISQEVVSAATEVAGKLGGATHALLIGAPGVSGDASGLGRFGAGKIRVAEMEALSGYHPEGYARVVADAIREGGYSAVIFGATTQGKDLAPRVAALLDVPLASDVTDLDVEGQDVVAIRPIFSGKVFSTVSFAASPALLSIRPNAFQAREKPGAGEVEVFQPEGVDPGSWKIKLKEFEAAGSGAKDVAEASIVVSGGRGMKDPDHWKVLEGLKDALGPDAALGASRAVVDAGWRPHSEQVGQTGKTVAPKLYFAIGISGAIQHLAGMRTSGTIVAVNKDRDAPIFQVADYGIVGDLFDVVPALAQEIRKIKEGD